MKQTQPIWEEQFENLYFNWKKNKDMCELIKQLIRKVAAESYQQALNDITKWAKKNNQCSDLVSTFDLLRYLEQLANRKDEK